MLPLDVQVIYSVVPFIKMYLSLFTLGYASDENPPPLPFDLPVQGSDCSDFSSWDEAE